MTSPHLHEKRREPRRKANGAVRIRLEGPTTAEIEGRLVDLSPSGFRMRHGYVALASGQTVEFSHVEAAGRARVMWNRVVGGHVETGFLVVGE